MKKQSIVSALLCAVFLLACAGSAFASPVPEEEPWIVDEGGFPVTCRAFLTSVQLRLEENQEAFLEENEEAVAADAYVATGQQLRVCDAAGAVLRSQPIVVMGDVTGTGTAGIGQIVRLAEALAGSEPLEGIWLQAGDLSHSGVIDIADLCLAAEQLQALSEGDRYELETRELLLYYSPEDSDPVRLTFLDGHMDLPYIDMETLVEWYEAVYEKELTMSEKDNIVLLTTDEGYVAELNFMAGTVFFSDFDAFFQQPFSSTLLDPLGDVAFLERVAGSFERYGLSIQVDLASREIPMVHQDGSQYLPLQTASDLFLSPSLLSVLFNGEACFMVSGDLGALEDLYYAVDPGPRSPELAQFTYDELCLAMDMLYGLSAQHNISTFDGLFTQTGLKEQLLSTDPVEADNAVMDMCMGYLGDWHSSFNAPSCYAGKDASISPSVVSASILESAQAMTRYAEARAAFYPDGVPSYEEIGDTAFVTFDSFTTDLRDDYTDRPLDPNSTDTLDIIRYAHAQITREDSPVENVVIDLSNNGGGDADAAVAVISWYLGTAVLNLNSTFTEAQASTRYQADINMDGVFDENDTIVSKNRYCLTSLNSFSSGNLVPACFKSSASVTLLGKPSGGGACIVQPLSMADGTVLQISGPLRLSTVMNGSFYDVDKGVDVDVPITRVEHFYDRDFLTDFIGGLAR